MESNSLIYLSNTAILLIPILLAFLIFGIYMLSYRLLEIFTTTLTNTRGFFGKLYKEGENLVIKIWNYIKNGAEYAWGRIKYFFNFLISSAIEVVDIVENVASDVVEAAVVVYNDAKAVVKEAIVVIESTFNAIVEAAKQIYNDFVDVVKTVANFVIDKAVEIFDTLEKLFDDLWKFIKKIVGFLKDIIDGIINFITDAIDFIVDLPENIIDGIGDIFSDIF